MTTDSFCFYLPNRLIQTSQTGGQRYSDTSPFSIPWPEVRIPHPSSQLQPGQCLGRDELRRDEDVAVAVAVGLRVEHVDIDDLVVTS